MNLKRIIFILVLFSPLALLPSLSNSDDLAETQARFGMITGDVGLLAQGAKDWIEPHEGLPIEIGDEIRTGEDGRVELVLSDNAVWLLESESHVVAERMDTNTGRLQLSSGTLVGKVDTARVAGTVQRWEFDTPAAVASVHGTEFGLVVSKKEGTHLGVFEGIVDLEPAETAEGLQPPIQVASGHEGVSKRGRPIQTLGKFGPAMQAIAAAVPAFRRRVRQIQNTWSPFTPATRLEARRKFVAIVPKSKAIPRPRQKKKIPVE